MCRRWKSNVVLKLLHTVKFFEGQVWLIERAHLIRVRVYMKSLVVGCIIDAFEHNGNRVMVLLGFTNKCDNTHKWYTPSSLLSITWPKYPTRKLADAFILLRIRQYRQRAQESKLFLAVSFSIDSGIKSKYVVQYLGSNQMKWVGWLTEYHNPTVQRLENHEEQSIRKSPRSFNKKDWLG